MPDGISDLVTTQAFKSGKWLELIWQCSWYVSGSRRVLAVTCSAAPKRVSSWRRLNFRCAVWHSSFSVLRNCLKKGVLPCSVKCLKFETMNFISSRILSFLNRGGSPTILRYIEWQEDGSSGRICWISLVSSALLGLSTNAICRYKKLRFDISGRIE